MVVLALETVTPQGSLAVWRDGQCRHEFGDAATPHAARLPGAWMRALSQADVALEDVDVLAVVSGPGSFTGVRIGMACAQGLALTRGWSVAAIPTLDAIAECWRATRAPLAPRVVVACLDGLRGEVFAREFAFDGVHLQALGVPQVVAPAQLRWSAHPGGVSFVGSGAVRYAGAWSAVSDDIADVPLPIAAGAAMLAARHEEARVVPHALRPLYVRRPDVELARDRKQHSRE